MTSTWIIAALLFVGMAAIGQNSESPFMCNRLALTPEARARHFGELGPMMKSLNTGVRELPNGYAFKFPADPKTIQLVAEWAAGEHACCPFFQIDMRIESENGSLWVTLSGRPGTKAFIEADLAEMIK